MKILAVLSVASLWFISHVSFTINESNFPPVNFTEANLTSPMILQSNDLKESMARGKTIYNEFCVTCHLGNGEGLKGTFPPLAKADFIQKFPDKAISAVKYGLKGKITVNGVDYSMPMANPGLDNQEVVDVINYVFNSWGNKSPIGTVTLKKVESIKPQ